MSKKASSLYLEKQLCFPLYAASRLTTKLYGPLLKELDITYPQYLVLLVLWQKGDQTVNEIGHQLLLESNTLTPLLKRLEEKKIIGRSRSAADERNVCIRLTPAGKKLKSKAMTIPPRILRSFKDEALSSQEIVQFQKTLQKLVILLDKKTSEFSSLN